VGALLTEAGGFRKRRSGYKIALVYPNRYEIGMANLGFHTVYSIFNGYEDVACERFFLGIQNSIETNSPLRSFDAIGFSLQYELDYINLIRILDASGIEPVRENRRGPIIMAGGPCCFNPLPLSKFVDLFVIGDLEPVADQIIEGLVGRKPPNSIAESTGGVFSPELMNPTQAQSVGNLDEIPAPINQPRPTSPEFSPALGSTFMVEISRGCNVRCRFCMYSHCTFPKRERSLHRIREIVDEGLRVTGSNKVSLIGALVTDHSEIKEIMGYLVERGVTASLPSIRTDSVDEEMLELIGELGIRTLTVAPEGSPHTREILKKDLGEEGLRFVIENAPDHGVRKLRLYFIVGVPGQTEEDIRYIGNLCTDSIREFKGRGAVTASINPLVPRPHTPTESLPMSNKSRLEGEYARVKGKVPSRVALKLQSIREAHLQAYLGMGNLKTGDVVLEASRASGGLGSWRRIAPRKGDPFDRIFLAPVSRPWRIVNTGISKQYLERQSREITVHATTGSGG
jgi:radical SAM superfamily enzyme YgiQ (UPF0313 family)